MKPEAAGLIVICKFRSWMNMLMQPMKESCDNDHHSSISCNPHETLEKRRRFWFLSIWVALIGVVVPPMLGVVGTVLGISRAFGSLSSSSSGVANPQELSNHISTVLVSTAAGLMVSVIAFMALIGVLIRFFTLPKASPVVKTSIQ